MPKKKTYIYSRDKLNKAQKDEKKRREDYETEQTLKDYKETFEIEEEDQSEMIFVRGGVYVVNQKEETQDDNKGKIYSFKPNDGYDIKTDIPNDYESKDSFNFNFKSLEKNKDKKKNIDIFLEEAQNIQKEEEKRKNQTLTFLNRKLKATDKLINNFHSDNENYNNSNLYLGNLSHNVTEEILFSVFRKFGEIESIKIIRNEDKSLKNIAFVCFKIPESAHKAKQELNELELCGLPIKIGWGKKYSPPQNKLNTNINDISSRQHVFVKIPENKNTKKIIDEFSSHIVEEGHSFEKVFLENESNNKDFTFLFDHKSHEHLYYRWKVFSLLQNDTDKSWRTEPFEIINKGIVWHPPLSTDQGNQKQRNFDVKNPDKMIKSNTIIKEPTNISNKITILPKEKMEEFINLLDQISLKRKIICNLMVFALDNVEFHSSILKLIQDKIQTGSYIDQISLMFLISDILFNSCSPSVPNIWHYKKEIENFLPETFEILNKSFKLINGRLSAQNMKENTLNLLKIWNKWGIFDEKFLFGLETTFLRKKLYKSDDILTDKDTSIENDLKLHLKKILEELKFKLNNTQEKMSFLEKQCKVYGLSYCEGNEQDIISRILSCEERKFLLEKEEKYIEHNIEEESNNDVLNEYNNIIDKLVKMLNSLQKSYKKIDENYIDGVKIDHVEYEVFNISRSEKKNIKIMNNSLDDNIDGEELNEKERNDIDGDELAKDLEQKEIRNNIEVDIDGEVFATLPEEINMTHKNLEINIKNENTLNVESVIDDIDGEPLEEDF